MSKIKEWFFNISKTVKEMFVRYPLTIGVILIVTTIFALSINQISTTDSFTENAVTFGAIFAASTFFIDSYFSKWTYKISTYIVAAIIATVLTVFINPDTKESINSAIAIRLAIGYIIILILTSIYKLLRDSKLRFEEYILKVFANLFICTITYIILTIGMTLLFSIFNELILEGKGENIIIQIEIILFGYFYLNSVLYSVTNVREKNVNALIKGLVIYLGLPLVTIAMAIIYLYIFKIIILRDMPSNVIFRILAGIFIVAFPVWNMASSLNQNKLIVKVTRVLPYSFCPFLLLEIYSIGVRVFDYGLTSFRYACIMFIVFQIAALVFTFIKNKELLRYLFLVAAVLVMILFISPLNCDNVSSISQKHILTKYLKNDTDLNSLSEDEKQKVVGAYDYLHGNVQYLKDIPAYISEDKIEKLRYGISNSTDYSDDGVRSKNYISKYNSAELDLDIDIRNYSRIAYVSMYNYNNDTSNLYFSNSKNLTVNVDLRDFIDSLINLPNDKFKTKFEQNNIVKVDDNKELYITSINISYDPSNNKIQNLGIKGYLLYK